MFADLVAEEANAATVVKQERLITVVVGNPPYAGQSANKGEWIGTILRDYYYVDGQPLGERNPKWLQDDYVKFIRLSQWQIDRSGVGILGFITNHGYLDNPTFRGMRQQLLATFDRIAVLDLHGNSKKREKSPDGSPDENVFDIQQGVGIGVFCRPATHSEHRTAQADLWGLREYKYDQLGKATVSSTVMRPVNPSSPFYLFIPPSSEALKDEYEGFWSITQFMEVNSVGIVTSRDSFVMDFDSASLLDRFERFLDHRSSDADVREEFFGTEGRREYLAGDNRDWQMATARRILMADPDWRASVCPCLYRPFDVRALLYHDAAIDFGRREVMRHLCDGHNLGLVTARTNKSPETDHFLLACPH
jgi:predicted helicase